MGVNKKIGVLALQGAFAEHIKMLDKLDVESCEIRKREDFTEDMDGLVIPGGESTVIGKLLTELQLLEPISQAVKAGLPVFGTCAGLILLAKGITDTDKVYLDAIDIEAKRNAYGRQLGSFSVNGKFGDRGQIPMVFIRAPYITSAGSGVETLSVVDGKVVAARQDNILVTAFHPELTEDTQVHEYFLSMVNRRS